MRQLRKHPAAKILFVLSGLAVTTLLSLRGTAAQRGIGLACSLAALGVMAFRSGFLDRAFSGLNRRTGAVSAGLSLLAGYRFAVDFHRVFAAKPAAAALAGIALPAVFVFTHFFTVRAFSFAKTWFSRADRAEKAFLAVCAPLFCAVLAVTFSVTGVFYAPRPGGSAVYDVVYTTDSSVLMDTNTYQSVNAKENDIRHPLFGLFAMPFGLAAGAVSKLLFFVPNAYPIVIGMIQVVPLLCGFVMLGRLLRLTGLFKILYLALSAASFPALLYTLAMERYTFTFFWLVLLIYLYAEKSGGRDWAFIAAAGATLTGGVLFPLLTDAKTLRGKARETGRCALRFFAVAALFGQLPLFLNAVPSLRGLARFTGVTLPFSGRLLQFLGFIAACFAAPRAGLDTGTFWYPSWQAEPSAPANVFGAVMLSAAALGFILNRKERFARICAGWAAFSFIILCIVGWGTAENGLVLYTLYFSWAYLSLVFMFAEKALARWKPVRGAVYAAAAAVMLGVNLPGLYQIIRFGVQYYPAR
ncbi:MAG: hypothetical protein LBH95_05730 [Oscillospiraceae bacterium]|jgi:hypothetical protein|nr:hypothetical protein [Oscillospiraceae bacterium]